MMRWRRWASATSTCRRRRIVYGRRSLRRARERATVPHDCRRADAGGAVLACGGNGWLGVPDRADADFTWGRFGEFAGGHSGPDAARNGQSDHRSAGTRAWFAARCQRACVSDALRSGLRSDERGVSELLPGGSAAGADLYRCYGAGAWRAGGDRSGGAAIMLRAGGSWAALRARLYEIASPGLRRTGWG